MNLANRRFCKNPDHISRVVDNQAIIVLTKATLSTTEKFFVLNDTGSRVWDLLDGRGGIGHIVRTICKEFDIAEKKAEEDTLEFFEELLKNGLISVSDN
ncbi:MAG: PqqD family protein [Candidatus Omnitrophica bacterium]|nr:PqqD family protein [Candidatus Omnitrophota bacterium]